MDTIRFNVTAVVEQEIQCMEGYDVHGIVAGLEEGTYATTIAHAEGEETPYIINVATGEPVAFIVTQEVAENTPNECFEFEIVKEDE